MRCDFFTIPVTGDMSGVADPNQLLTSARVLSVDRHFVGDGANSGALVRGTIRATARRRPFPWLR